MAVVPTGSVLTFAAPGTANTGTVSTTITVPADAELVTVGWSGYSGTANFFSSGVMQFTKGGVDTNMVSVGVGDADTGKWEGALFYLGLPDTGANKTLKWNWLGTAAADDPATLCSVAFWKGNDTSAPLRAGGGAQAAATPYTTGSIAGASGDLAIGWVGAFATPAEGSINTWSNLSLLSGGQIARSGNADGAWATGSPSGASTYAASTDTNIDDGAFIVGTFKAASGGTTQALGGVAATTGVGTFVPSSSALLVGVSATAGTGTFVDTATKALTGVGASASVGSFLDTVAQPLSGVTAAATVGAFVDGVTEPLTGVAAATAVGTLVAATGTIQALTGVAAVTDVGTFLNTVVELIDGVACASAVGSFAPLDAIALSGIAATATVGDFLQAITIPLGGVGAAADAGIFVDAVVEPLGGVAAVSGVGTFGVDTPVVVNLSGAAAASAAGTFLQAITIPLGGVGVAAQVGILTTIPGVITTVITTRRALYRRGVSFWKGVS